MGNGLLAEAVLAVVERECQVLFCAHTRDDLDEVVRLKHEHPAAYGVLASYGVMVPERVLKEFEPEGIINIHPSLLPEWRGASPIESAILSGADEYGVSVMKLVKAMDAGPLYHQEVVRRLPLDKAAIYGGLATAGAEWLVKHLDRLPEQDGGADSGQLGKRANGQPEGLPVPTEQVGEPTFCGKLDKAMGQLTPEVDTAELTLRKIVAFQGFPKPKYTFFGLKCIVLAAHIAEVGERAELTIPCADGRAVVVERLQPEGRKPMDARAFINGYGKR